MCMDGVDLRDEHEIFGQLYVMSGIQRAPSPLEVKLALAGQAVFGGAFRVAQGTAANLGSAALPLLLLSAREPHMPLHPSKKAPLFAVQGLRATLGQL